MTQQFNKQTRNPDEESRHMRFIRESLPAKEPNVLEFFEPKSAT